MRNRVIPARVITLVALVLPLLAAEAQGRSGGVSAPVTPTLRAVTCLTAPARPCPPDRALVRGGRMRVAGSGLHRVRALVFLGGARAGDDALVRSLRRRGDRVEARVPANARTGPLVALSGAGRIRLRQPVRVSDGLPVDDATGRKFYFDGARKPSFSLKALQPAEARVEVVRDSDGTPVDAWSLPIDPGNPRVVQWEGLAGNGAQPPGRYRFRLAGGGASVASAHEEAASAFTFYDHIFPIRARHNLGYTDTNNFGGGRDHRGQDMFARCGARIVAARGGTVEQAGYHAAAGYYVVIDGRATGSDYVYMHMRRPPLVRTGQRVRTAQAIGEVGESGRAQGCHLHFELWTAPGWYSGGRPVDPRPGLAAWDAYS